MQSKKITLTTFKSFIKKNEKNLFVQTKSKFDGMIDGCNYFKNPPFEPVQWREGTGLNMEFKSNFNIQSLYIVPGSRNSFSPFENENYIGIDVYNCCGSWRVCIPK